MHDLLVGYQEEEVSNSEAHVFGVDCGAGYGGDDGVHGCFSLGPAYTHPAASKGSVYGRGQ